jgi:PAS domain S-box-containing protein
MLGYESKEEFLKIDIAKDLYLEPEDRQKFQEMIERDGRVIDYEVDFKRKDGKAIPVLLTSHVRYDQDGNVLGYEGINVDQSQRKSMEREIKEAHDFLNKVIQSSPNSIMASDMKGDIIIWNRAAEETLGYKAGETIGKMNIRNVYPEGVATEIMEMMRSPEYGGVGRLRSHPMVYVRRDGNIVEGDLSAAIIYDANGKETASVGTFVDLKERLEMERKLRQTQEQLLQSEKLAAMGRLTSQIAHELNNPLYGIMNTLELMKTEIPPESKRRKILEMALSETMRLTEMLRKMLSFSKPDEEEKQPTDINIILDEILLLHEKQLRENSIRISSNFAKNLGKVHASKNQLRQVFLNMISNARDAMPDGGTLTVRTRAKGDNVQIKISDTGVGIRDENIDRIFDSFFTTKDNVKDVGLGLSVCYGFIKDHGGNIKVESELGSGTTFAITLPTLKEVSEEEDLE